VTRVARRTGLPLREVVSRAEAEARGLDDFSPLWSGTTPNVFAASDAATVTRVLAGIA